MIEHMMATSQPDPEWEKEQGKRVKEAWGSRFSPERTQRPEWEETRKKAEAQLEEVNLKFNPPPVETGGP